MISIPIQYNKEGEMDGEIEKAILLTLSITPVSGPLEEDQENHVSENGQHKDDLGQELAEDIQRRMMVKTIQQRQRDTHAHLIIITTIMRYK